MLDYRGYGKSDGQVESEDQLHQDVRAAYDEMRKRYDEDKIVVLGYSLGSGPASKLAAENSPRLLILQAPYFSLKDVAKRSFPFIPVVLLKYKLETNRYITACKMPVVLIHGDQDEVIYYESSLKLKALLKPTDPPDVTSFYHDDMRRLIKMEIPSGNDVVVYRYEYDTNDNVVRIFYTLPGQQEFLGRENLSFNDMSTLHSRYQDLYFLDTYVFRRLPLRQNVESALLYSNGPLYRLKTPTVVTYQYSFNDDGLIVSRSSDYHGIIGEYNFSEVDYVCK